jgi:hypothetical protein
VNKVTFLSRIQQILDDHVDDKLAQIRDRVVAEFTEPAIAKLPPVSRRSTKPRPKQQTRALPRPPKSKSRRSIPSSDYAVEEEPTPCPTPVIAVEVVSTAPPASSPSAKTRRATRRSTLTPPTVVPSVASPRRASVYLDRASPPCSDPGPSKREDPEIELREDDPPPSLRREPIRRVRPTDAPPPELWNSPDLEDPPEDLEPRPRPAPAGCGSCIPCIAKSGPCARGKGPSGRRLEPDLANAPRSSGRALPSAASDSRARDRLPREAIRFDCPACGSAHWRGFVDGVSLFKCLRCGYQGHGFHTDPKLDRELVAKYGPGNAAKYDPRAPDRAWSKD